MTIEVDTLIYKTILTATENGLIEVMRIERRKVIEVLDSYITTDELICIEFPTHTPPFPVVYPPPPTASRVVLSCGDVGTEKLWETSEPVVAAAEVIDDAQVEADYLAWTNRKLVAREMGRPQPVISDEQRRLFLIWEFRQGCLAF